MPDHPLDKALDVDPAEEVENLFTEGLKIPDDPNMSTVVKFALEQYKKIAEEAMLYEPEQRIEILRLAREYLDLAKDTMYKESDLSIKAEKNQIQREVNKAKNPKLIDKGNEDEDDNEGDNDSQKTLSYQEAMKRIHQERKK